MYRLKLLGRLTITGPDDSDLDRASQPRQLALLALLAASDSPLTRDRLAGCLWPGEDNRRARRRLSDALYALRQDLGAEAIRTVGDGLELNRSVVGSDLADYEGAIASGDLARAASLYGGPFLNGFVLSGSPEFERWVDAERERLARSYGTALENLARAAEQRGDDGEALRWWRQLAESEPYSSQAAQRLVEALVKVGDRSSALQVARAHEQRIRSELDATPDPEFLEFVERLRATGEPTEGFAASSMHPTTARSRSRRLGVIAGALLLAALAAAAIWIRWGASRSPEVAAGLAEPVVVAALPWTIRGDASDLNYLEEGLVDLLSLSLDELPGVRSVDPYAVVNFVERWCTEPADPDCGSAAADQFGARHFVVGTIVPLADETFRLWASVHDADGAELHRTSVPAASAGPTDAVQELTRRISGMLVGSGDLTGAGPSDPKPLSARTTGAAPALRAYLEGASLFRSFQLDEAMEALLEAVAIDSAFALAWCRLAVTAELKGTSSSWLLADSAAEQALQRADHLPDRERKLMRAFNWLRLGKADRAERAFRDLLTEYPENFVGRHLLGEIQYHYNVVRGLPPGGEEAFKRVLEIQPDFRPALWHLRLDALSKGRIGEFDSLTSHFLSLAPDLETAGRDGTEDEPNVRTLVIRYARLARADHKLVALLRAEDDSTRERWFADLEGTRGTELAWIAGIHLENLSWPGRVDDAMRMARILTDPSRRPSARAQGYVGLGSIAIREGRWRDAFRQLDRLAEVDPVQAALWRADWASSLFLRLPASELSRIRAELAALLEGSPRFRPAALPLVPIGWTTTPPAEMETWGLFRLSILSSRLGDYGEAQKYAARLEAMKSSEGSELGTFPADIQHALRAVMMWEQGNVPAARAALDSIRHEVRWQGLSTLLYPQLFLRAEALYASGELEEARQWYTLWTHLRARRFLGPALHRLGQIHEALGEPEKALSRYEEFVSLWRNADPELQPRVQQARNRIATLSNAQPVTLK